MRRRRTVQPAPVALSLAASVSIEEAVSALLEIRGAMTEIRAATVKSWLTVPEISKRYLAGRSATWIRARPWALPGYGVPDIPGRPEAWYVSSCEEWYRTPLHVLEARYFNELGGSDLREVAQ